MKDEISSSSYTNENKKEIKDMLLNIAKNHDNAEVLVDDKKNNKLYLYDLDTIGDSYVEPQKDLSLYNINYKGVFKESEPISNDIKNGDLSFTIITSDNNTIPLK